MPKITHREISLYENLSRDNNYLWKVILSNFEKLMTDKFKEKDSNSSEVAVTVALENFSKKFRKLHGICL